MKDFVINHKYKNKYKHLQVFTSLWRVLQENLLKGFKYGLVRIFRFFLSYNHL